MKLFETSRLFVRQVQPPDLVFLHAIYTNPENMQFISSGRSDWSQEEVAEKYAKNNVNYREGFGLYAVELKETGRLIGEAGLFDSFNDRSIMELGYILDRPVWGNGYGTELCQGLIGYCFRTLQAEKVVARMYAVNTGSVRVCEKAGMRQAGQGTAPDGRSFYRYEIEK